MKKKDGFIFGFIGLGNMGSAILSGLVESGGLTGAEVLAHDPDRGRIEAAMERYGIRSAANLREVFESADMILLGVKPNLSISILEDNRESIARRRPALVSIAVNKPFDELIGHLPKGTELLVVMPNLPISVGSGVLCCERKHSFKKKTFNLFAELFHKIAQPVILDGSLMGVAGAISACGPAFVALFIEALADAGNKRGLSRKDAYLLASAMIEGSAKLQRESGKHPAVLKDEVCSPGGTTIRGVLELDRTGFRASIEAAIGAAMGEKG